MGTNIENNVSKHTMVTNIVNWSDELSYGIKAMDDDHKVMIDLINRMYSIASEKKDKFDVKLLLAKLAEYAILHFRREEIVMKTCQYPDYDNHIEDHHELEKKVFELLKYKDRHFSPQETDELLQFLSTWLYEHISEVDQTMAPHVANYLNEIEEALVGTTPVPKLKPDLL